MLDFEVQRFTRRCASSDRELRPGETFYSVLVADGADVVRRDYATDAWSGPPEDCLGWWKSQVPDPRAKKMQWAPHEVMLHYFEEISEQPGKEDTRYVLALLLVRRKIFRLEASDDEPTNAQQVMNVYCGRNETSYAIAVVNPSAHRVAEIQQELAELLMARGE